jgi:hypothetical protein
MCPNASGTPPNDFGTPPNGLGTGLGNPKCLIQQSLSPHHRRGVPGSRRKVTGSADGPPLPSPPPAYRGRGEGGALSLLGPCDDGQSE